MTPEVAAILALVYVAGMAPARLIAKMTAEDSAAGSWPAWLHVVAVGAWPAFAALLLLILVVAIAEWAFLSS